jgi:hypothetical protein
MLADVLFFGVVDGTALGTGDCPIDLMCPIHTRTEYLVRSGGVVFIERVPLPAPTTFIRPEQDLVAIKLAAHSQVNVNLVGNQRLEPLLSFRHPLYSSPGLMHRAGWNHKALRIRVLRTVAYFVFPNLAPQIDFAVESIVPDTALLDAFQCINAAGAVVGWGRGVSIWWGSEDILPTRADSAATARR